MTVVEAWRVQGIGSKMLQRMEKDAAQLGILVLVVDCPPCGYGPYESAHGFYTNHGYIPHPDLEREGLLIKTLPVVNDR